MMLYELIAIVSMLRLYFLIAFIRRLQHTQVRPGNILEVKE